MSLPAHDLPHRPHLSLVPDQPAAPTSTGRTRPMIGVHGGVLLGLVAEGSGQLAGLSFTQDLVITAVPVVGGMVVAVAEGLRRRHRAGRDEADARRLDEEYHKDLRRQIARLERQVDDLARQHAGRPLRGEKPPDGAA